MGSLTPGATYVYERADGRIYAREFGADPSTRKVIGYDLESSPERKNLTLWNDILTEAETNPALHEAIERVKVIYYLN